MEPKDPETTRPRRPKRARRRRSEAPPPEPPVPAPDAPVTEVRQGFFQAEDGTPIYFESQGTGPALVLCYGLMCRRQHWRHQIEKFRGTHQVVVFDYRGHQRSGRPRNDRNLTVPWVARDLSGLLDHLKLEQAVAFGHSLGVPVAVEALARDERIKAGVLICGAVTNPFEHMFYTDRIQSLYRWTALAHEHAPHTAELLWKRFTALNGFNVALTKALGFNPRVADEQDVLSYMEGVTETPFAVFQAFLRDYTQYDGRPQLSRIRQPVLLVAGDEDVITPTYLMEEMSRLLPRAELSVVAEASHNAHMDFPGEVNDKIAAFLSKVGFL